MSLKVTNNAFGTLNAGISDSDVTIVLEAGQGARFPVLGAGDYFYATLIDTSNNLEIVKVTARATDTMTIVRAQDNTSARVYNVNDRFELRPTAALFNEKLDADNPSYTGTLTGAGDATLHGLTVGRGAGAVSSNTAVGASALAANTSGAQNTAFGLEALKSNTTADWNSAFGRTSLTANTTGANNTGLGGYTLNANTTGGNNTAVGMSALISNTTASNNTAVGYQAAYSTTTAGANIAIGYQALYSNTTGQLNVAIGSQALYAQTADAYNTAVGGNSMQSTTTGSENAALGRLSLNANTTGLNNTAVGYAAGLANTTGTRNVHIGHEAGYSQTVASGNTFVGRGAGYLTTGQGNTFIGFDAGYSVTTGVNNTFIGPAYAGINGGVGDVMTTGSRNVIIGRFTGNQGGIDIRTSSNHIVLSDGDGNPRMYFNASGNPFIPSIRAAAGTYTAKITAGSAELTFDTSSARYKDNIRDSSYGLNAVMALRSAMFEYKSDPTRTDVGLIAEEVYEVIPELVAVNADGQKDAVNYDRFVSVCIKAIQELNAKVDAQAAEIATLKGQP
jgi:hypothetical protein